MRPFPLVAGGWPTQSGASLYIVVTKRSIKETFAPHRRMACFCTCRSCFPCPHPPLSRPLLRASSSPLLLRRRLLAARIGLGCPASTRPGLRRAACMLAACSLLAACACSAPLAARRLVAHAGLGAGVSLQAGSHPDGLCWGGGDASSPSEQWKLAVTVQFVVRRSVLWRAPCSAKGGGSAGRLSQLRQQLSAHWCRASRSIVDLFAHTSSSVVLGLGFQSSKAARSRAEVLSLCRSDSEASASERYGHAGVGSIVWPLRMCRVGFHVRLVGSSAKALPTRRYLGGWFRSCAAADVLLDIRAPSPRPPLS